jgi:ATP-dependent DNA helicase RecG
MKETQHIEWKESWRDEYLKWLCGFANADGGTLVIGKNDRGEVMGVPNVQIHYRTPFGPSRTM